MSMKAARRCIDLLGEYLTLTTVTVCDVVVHCSLFVDCLQKVRSVSALNERMEVSVPLVSDSSNR